MTVTIDRPRAQGYGVRLGDQFFRLAAAPDAPLRVYTRDSLAERQDQRGSSEENVLDIGYAFSRSNLTGGEGLDWWPRVAGEKPFETDLIRFWNSGNIDIRRPRAGDAYTLTLPYDVVTFWTPVASPTDMNTSKDAIYIIEGSNVHRFDDWGDTTPDDSDTPAGALIQLAVGSDNSVAVLTAAGDVWYKGAQTDTYLLIYDSTSKDPITAIWVIKDRVIAARNEGATATQGEMIEIAPGIAGTPASPTATPIDTVIDTFEGEMLSAVDAGHAIVAGFSDGSIRSYVPQSDTAGSTPVLTIRANTQVPHGEVAYALGHNLGVLTVLTLEEMPGTSKTTTRFYTATVLDIRFDYVVGQLQLVRTWEETIESAPDYTKNIVVTRDEAFFWIGEDTTTYHLWRFDFVTQGLFRHAEHGRTTTAGTVVFDGILGFCDGADVYTEDITAFVSMGYLITPNITFGLNTKINWTNFTLEALGLETAGVKVELYRSSDPRAILDKDDISWILVQTLIDPTQSGIEQAVLNAVSNSLALQIRLYPSVDGLTAPNVTRFAVRGLPTHRDWLCEIPINVSDVVEIPGRMPLRIPGQGDLAHTQALNTLGSNVELEVFDTPVTLRGVVDKVVEPVTYVTARGSQGRVCVLVFRGVRIGGIGGAVVAQGQAGVGIGPTGIATVGIGEVT